MTALDLRIKSDGNPPTLGDIVRIQARTWPDLVAMVFGGRETSYGELERASFDIANAVRAAGLAGGDRQEGVVSGIRCKFLDHRTDLSGKWRGYPTRSEI
jgi:non-ribosomal peptide synthetase component E (peptide arylation enzyme)